jgi:GNAT superfamily N-acetyltransferase
MNWQIRAAVATDYEAIARLRNQTRPDQISAAELVAVDQTADPTLTRLVVELDGQVIAMGWVGDADWLPEGIWQIGVAVDRAHRGHGAGEALRQALEERALAGGAAGVEAYLRGPDESADGWLLKRGYTLYRQRTEAVLDLKAFDFGPFAGAIERTAATGITFYGQEGRLPEALLQGAYEVDRATTFDVPGYGDITFPTYERWVKDLEPGMARTYWVLALDGERVVGLTNLEWYEQDDFAHTGLTGVLREYRSRGIALAMKLHAIAEAQRRGFVAMRTNNDPDNPPMLAVNRKLGYVFVRGPRRMRKALAR